MRLLLDSNIMLPFTRKELPALGAGINLLLQSPANEIFISAASLWEIAIKVRLGKLDPLLPVAKFPAYFTSIGFQIVRVDEHHAVAELDVLPDTRDPFDRLLLAQCQVENMRLVTVDRGLAIHPLAWRDRG